MVGKRFFLIAGGTVGGLGVVLSITPPQFGSATGLTLGGGTLPTSKPVIPGTGGDDQRVGPVLKPKPDPKPVTHKAAPKAPSKSPKASPAPTPANTPAPANTPTPASLSGTFTGAAAGTFYGPVQVQITIVNGVITKAVALTYPTGTFRDQQINQQAIPYLIQETLTAQSANIQGVGGASFTSQGWATSLQSALVKAGL